MKPLLFIIPLLLLVACDGPRYQNRFPGKTYTLIPGDEGNNGGADFPEFERDEDIPEEIQHCNWNEYIHTDNHLGGEYTFCQSKSSETEIHIKLKNTEMDEDGNPVSICFFPTNMSDGETTLLGEKRCRTMVDENRYKIVFRKSFSDAALNSLIVVKDKPYSYERPFPVSEVKGSWAFEKCMAELRSRDDYCRSFQAKGEYLSHSF